MDLGVVRAIHRPKLQEREGSAVLAYALLAEENRSGRGELDGRCNRQKDRRENDQPNRAAEHVDTALDHSFHSRGLVALREIRIELRIRDESRTVVLIPVFRETVKRDVHATQLVSLQIRLQGASHLCPQRRQRGLPVRRPELGKDHAENRAIFVPAGNVRFTDHGAQGGDGAIENVLSLVGELMQVNQHQNEESARAFRSLPLQTERTEERCLGQEGALQRRDPIAIQQILVSKSDAILMNYLPFFGSAIDQGSWRLRGQCGSYRGRKKTPQMLKPTDGLVKYFAHTRAVPDALRRCRLPGRCAGCPRSAAHGERSLGSRTRGGRRGSAHSEPCVAPSRSPPRP